MVALKLTKALREALQRAEAWPAEAQNELARLALEIEAGVRGRPIHVSYAGPAEAPKSFAVRGSYKSKEYKYPVSEELSPPEFFRKLSAASQLGTGTFMAVYAANIKTVRALHVNPMLRRGRINSANCQEALDLTKVSAVLHDVSFVNLTGAESFAMLSVSEVAGSETEISVGLSKTLPQAIFEQISQSDSLCLYYLMRHDDSTEALLRDLAPFIERGRVVVEPERSVFYAVAHDENGKLVYHTIKVPPDSPANEWNVHFTEPSVQEQDTQTTRQNFQDEKLYQPSEGLTLGYRGCGVIHFCPDRLIRGNEDERGDRGSGRF